MSKLGDLRARLAAFDSGEWGKRGAAHKVDADFTKASFANPFDPSIRVLPGMVGMELSPSLANDLKLNSIISFGQKGQGNASEALDYLGELADKHGSAVSNYAKAFKAGADNAPGMNTPQLIAWYKRHGFVPDVRNLMEDQTKIGNNWPYLVRPPKGYAKGSLVTLKDLMEQLPLDVKDRLAEEAKQGRVPHGMFSPLDQLIQQQSFEAAPPHQWLGALKPGTMVTRGGTNFPLKQEEVDFTGIHDALSKLQQQMMEESKPKQPITRRDLVNQRWRDLKEEYRSRVPPEHQKEALSQDPLAAYHDVLNQESHFPMGMHPGIFDHMMEGHYLRKEDELGRPLTRDEIGQVQKEEYGRYSTYPGNETLPKDPDEGLVAIGGPNTSYEQDRWLGRFRSHIDQTDVDPARNFLLGDPDEEEGHHPGLPLTSGGLRKEDILAWLRAYRPELVSKQGTEYSGHKPAYVQTGAYPDITRIENLPRNSPIHEALDIDQHYDSAHSWNRSAPLTNPEGLTGHHVVEVQSDPHRRASDLIMTPPPDLLAKAQALLDSPGLPDVAGLTGHLNDRLTEKLLGTRENPDETVLPGWGTRRRGYGSPNTNDRMREQPVTDQLPFQGIKGYGALELKKALNFALQNDRDFLSLADGADQEQIYGGLKGRQITGMHAVYDPMVTNKNKVTGVERQEPGIYAQILRNLAKQYNVPYDPAFPIAKPGQPTGLANPNTWHPERLMQGYQPGQSLNDMFHKKVETFMDEFDPSAHDNPDDEDESIIEQTKRDNYRALNNLHRFVYQARRNLHQALDRAYENGHLSEEDYKGVEPVRRSMREIEDHLSADAEDADGNPRILSSGDLMNLVDDIPNHFNRLQEVLAKGEADYHAKNPPPPEGEPIRRQSVVLPAEERERLRRTGISPWMLAAGAAGLGAMQPDDSQAGQFAKGGLLSLKEWIKQDKGLDDLQPYRIGLHGRNTDDYVKYLEDQGFNPKFSDKQYQHMVNAALGEYDGLGRLSKLAQQFSIPPPQGKTIGRGLVIDPGERFRLDWPAPQSFSTRRDVYDSFSNLDMEGDRAKSLQLLMTDPPEGFKMLPVPVSGENEWVMPGDVKLSEVGSGSSRRMGNWMNVKPTKWADGGEVEGYEKGGLIYLRDRLRNSRDALKKVKALPPEDFQRAEQMFDLSPGLDKYMSPDSIKHLFPTKNQWPIAMLDPSEFRSFALPGDYDEQYWKDKVKRIGKTIDKHGLVDYPNPDNRYDIAVPGLSYEQGAPIRRQTTMDVTGHEGRHRSDVFDDLGLQMPTVMVGGRGSWDNWALNKGLPATPLQKAVDYLTSVRKVRPEGLNYLNANSSYMDSFDIKDMMDSAKVSGGIGPFDLNLKDRVFAKGGLIDTFLKRRSGQLGSFKNPDLEVPKGYSSFYTRVSPSGKHHQIFGVAPDGTERLISTVGGGMEVSGPGAEAIAKAYNAGGYDTAGIQKVPLSELFGYGEPDKPEGFAKGGLERLAKKFHIDNPGGSWLEHQRAMNAEDGVTEHGVPRRFGSVTGSFDAPVHVPLEQLAATPGMKGEQMNVRQDDLDWLTKYMGENGKLPPGVSTGKEHAPFIQVDQDGNGWVNDGNHRIMAANNLGWKHLPTEVRYYAGGEKADGPWHPDKLMAMDADLNGRARFAKGGAVESDWKKPKSWAEAYKNRASMLDRASSALESELSYWDDKAGEPRYIFGPETDEEKNSVHMPRGWHLNDIRLTNDVLGLPADMSDLSDTIRDWAAKKLRTPQHDTIHTLRNLIAGKIATDEKTDPLHTGAKTSITPETDRLLDLSRQHSDRGSLIRQAVMSKNGIAPPVDLKETGADVFGEMAGQAPIPAAWLRRLKTMRGIGGPLGAVSEYLGPTISSRSGYLLGTAGGVGLGAAVQGMTGPAPAEDDLTPQTTPRPLGPSSNDPLP